jgi:hypothetical protein
LTAINAQCVSAIICSARASYVVTNGGTNGFQIHRRDSFVDCPYDWRSIGPNKYWQQGYSPLQRDNANGRRLQKIGEIKDVLLAKSGKADKVILSVGGFLGLREHYVAVPFDQIKWVDEPARSASGDTRTTTGAATTTSSARKWYPDHAAYNATKDQLTAMPEFKY